MAPLPGAFLKEMSDIMKSLEIWVVCIVVLGGARQSKDAASMGTRAATSASTISTIEFAFMFAPMQESAFASGE